MAQKGYLDFVNNEKQPKKYGATIQGSTDLSSSVVTPMTAATVPEIDTVDTTAGVGSIPTTGSLYLDALEKQRLYKNQLAADNYQKAYVDAANKYQNFVNPYGYSQAKIADMGLSGSGYSEYLKDRAYMGMISEQQAALSQKALAERDAQNTYDSKYLEYALQEDSRLKAIGTELATLSGEDKIAALETFIESGELTADDELYKRALAKAYADIDANPDYEKLINLSKEALDAYLVHASETGNVAATNKLTAKSIVNVGGKTLGVDEREFSIAESGDKIDVTFGADRYTVRKGDKVTNASIAAAARDIEAPGAVAFKYGDNVYIAYNGEAYAVNEKNSNVMADLKDLLSVDRIFLTTGKGGEHIDQNGNVYTRDENGLYSRDGQNYSPKYNRGRVELIPI